MGQGAAAVRIPESICSGCSHPSDSTGKIGSTRSQTTGRSISKTCESDTMNEDDQSRPVEGRRIGPYRVVREIGRGGMGAVYLAARADEQFEQRVAIKLIKRGMDTDDIIRRFRNERQILANLRHPHIATLLDGGITEEGLPYFAMDYVEGAPIDQYCDQHKLSIRNRLNLFRMICSAVQFAHQNLIVHRDIKPGNIIVTPEGVPVLLDFGIAKLLDAEHSQETMPGQRPMTPECASPEQVRGEPITTASDIYSLGILLYKLLTGHQPYRFASGLPQIMLVTVTERTREIGLRKAIGARRSEILYQFLIEAGVISGVGSLLGILIALAIPVLVRPLLPGNLQVPVPWLSVVLAFLVACSVGLFFGYLPASKAAQLPPTESLRYE